MCVVGEGEIVDRLAHVGLMCLLQQVQVVDAGGFDRGSDLGFDRGVGVAADGVAEGPPIARPWYSTSMTVRSNGLNSNSTTRPTRPAST